MIHTTNANEVNNFCTRQALGKMVLYDLGFKSGKSLRLSQISTVDPNVEEYWFFCQQWLDKSSGDKQTVRELLPTDENGNPLSDRDGKYQSALFERSYFCNFRSNIYGACFHR